MNDMAPVLACFAIIGGICWVAWVIISNRRRREWIQASSEFHRRLLDKLGSAGEFSEFLESDGGRRFLKSMSSEQGSTQRRILSALQAGMVLSFLGLGLLIVGHFVPYDDGAFSIMGAIALSTGLGFLVSAMVSRRLTSQWTGEN